MKTDLVLLFTLAYVTAFAQCISIPTKINATNTRLWSLSDGNSGLDDYILKDVKGFARSCCTNIWGYDPTDCNKWQLAYWVVIPEIILDNQIREWLNENFNPSVRTKDAEVMCNCKRNPQTKQCEPVTNHEPFPFFAFGTGSSDTHSEKVLLPHIAWEAQELMDQYNSKFYLYSFNSPCSGDPGSCLSNIFYITANNMYKNQKRFHQMNVGFYDWYLNKKLPHRCSE